MDAALLQAEIDRLYLTWGLRAVSGTFQDTWGSEMKSGKIGAMVVLLAGAGWAAAQPLANGVPPGSAATLNPPGSAPYGGAPGMVYPVVPAYGP